MTDKNQNPVPGPRRLRVEYIRLDPSKLRTEQVSEEDKMKNISDERLYQETAEAQEAADAYVQIGYPDGYGKSMKRLGDFNLHELLVYAHRMVKENRRLEAINMARLSKENPDELEAELEEALARISLLECQLTEKSAEAENLALDLEAANNRIDDLHETLERVEMHTADVEDHAKGLNAERNKARKEANVARSQAAQAREQRDGLAAALRMLYWMASNLLTTPKTIKEMFAKDGEATKALAALTETGEPQDDAEGSAEETGSQE